MAEHPNGYASNRKKERDVVRIVTELPAKLVSDVDEWGVSAGMTSRREATETLLKKGLEAVQHGAA
ncbi:hypothetical protein [Pseudogemmobacter sonorensis]|uniref:hypothetical protein n=1 Tax=Pseudogemmobacter sonorensis TaxID=2989681 RepID=UPI003696E495